MSHDNGMTFPFHISKTGLNELNQRINGNSLNHSSVTTTATPTLKHTHTTANLCNQIQTTDVSESAIHVV